MNILIAIADDHFLHLPKKINIFIPKSRRFQIWNSLVLRKNWDPPQWSEVGGTDQSKKPRNNTLRGFGYAAYRRWHTEFVFGQLQRLL